MHEYDLLKLPETITEQDPRSRMTAGVFDADLGAFRYPDIEDHYATVSPLVLDPRVPEEVAVSFEVAKNLYLYSHYVYRFGVVSAVQALQSLEYALRERAKLAGVTTKALMLGKLMNMAIEEGWLTDTAFKVIPGFQPPGGDRYARTLAKTLPGMRNILAHGSFTLFEPHRALEHLRICAAIIDAVFQNMPACGSTTP